MQNHVNRTQMLFFKGFYQPKPGKYCFLTSLKSAVFSHFNVILGHIKNGGFYLWSHNWLCYHTYWTAMTKRFLISCILLVSHFKIIWILHNKGTVCCKMLVALVLMLNFFPWYPRPINYMCLYVWSHIFIKEYKKNTCVWICVCAGTHTPAH